MLVVIPDKRSRRQPRKHAAKLVHDAVHVETFPPARVHVAGNLVEVDAHAVQLRKQGGIGAGLAGLHGQGKGTTPQQLGHRYVRRGCLLFEEHTFGRSEANAEAFGSLLVGF
ncbi:MAG: hypothetical protein AAF593_00640 [Planctomycetota bacterium]